MLLNPGYAALGLLCEVLVTTLEGCDCTAEIAEEIYQDVAFITRLSFEVRWIRWG